jgi:PAS domain S-box-containing protein
MTIEALLATDDDQTAQLVRDRLQTSSGVAVARVQRLDECIAAARQRRFDVVLLDLDLPDSSGRRTFDEFHLAAPECPLLVLAGAKDEALDAPLMQAGAQDFLLKREIATFPLLRAVRHAIVRSRSGAAATESQAQDAQLFESIPTPCFIYETNTLAIRAVNDEAISLYGWSRAEFLSMTLRDIRPPEDVHALENVIAGLGTATRCARPSRHLKKDGKVLYVDVGSRPFRSQEDGTRIAIAMDVSQRYRADDRFSKVFQQSPLPICICTADEGRFIDVNNSLLQMYDYQREDLIGHTAREAGVWPDTADNTSIETALNADGSLKHVELALRTKHGRNVQLLASLEIIELDGKDCVLAMGLDVTDRRKAEEAAGRLASIVDSSSDAIISATLDGLVESWNGGAARIYGYTADEMIGHSLALLFPDEQQERLAEVIAGIKQREHLSNFETKHRRKDGRLIDVSMTFFRVLNRHGQVAGVATIGRDVTEAKALEVQLLHAQKMEAVGRLAGGIAHDFNNMLTAILGYTELMLPKIPAHGELLEIVTQIQSAAKRSEGLTRQLLTFSRKQSVAPNLQDLNSIVSALGKILARVLGEDIELATSLEPDLSLVKVDVGQMEQVIVNLAVNARDAMPRGGSLRIETHNVAPPNRDGDFVLLRVRDTGVGMHSEVKSRLFEPFFTTKELGKGTGLGLAIVHGIVTQCGGFIEVSGEPGAGATFDIYLPACAATDSSLPKETRSTSDLQGDETILVVEDDEIVRNMVQKVLQNSGFSTLHAASGAEALRILAKPPQRIDLLLSDVVMPGMSGPQLADRVNQTRSEIKTLFMSGYVGEAITQHGVEDSTIRLMQKPFSSSELLRAVRDVLDN